MILNYCSDCQIIGNSATVNLNEGFRSILQFCIATTMIIKLAPPELLFVSIGGIVTIMGVSRSVQSQGSPVRQPTEGRPKIQRLF